MANAIDFAKLFIKRGLDTHRNTYDGNMKIQKLLFFANIISLSEKGEPLFADPICAFKNGCVIESVRLRYKNDYANLYSDSVRFKPDFTQDQYDVINLTGELFGQLSAKELSELDHSFSFWHTALERSNVNEYRNKELSIISLDEMRNELSAIKKVIDSYKTNIAARKFKEVVNGIIFYYDSTMTITDEILEQLESFSFEAEDDAYTIYIDDGNLVIY